jgi:hypothetical protein
MPFIFYYFLSLGNQKKNPMGPKQRIYAKTMIPIRRISRKDFLELWPMWLHNKNEKLEPW